MSNQTRIIRIGNSQGVRIPKSLLKISNLPEEVEILAEPGRIILQAAHRPRAGWLEAAKRFREQGEDVLLDPPTPTAFDHQDWKW